MESKNPFRDEVFSSPSAAHASLKESPVILPEEILMGQHFTLYTACFTLVGTVVLSMVKWNTFTPLFLSIDVPLEVIPLKACRTLCLCIPSLFLCHKCTCILLSAPLPLTRFIIFPSSLFLTSNPNHIDFRFHFLDQKDCLSNKDKEASVFPTPVKAYLHFC